MASMRRLLSCLSACCVLAAIAFVTVSPIEWRPDDILGVDADRALAFAILGGLFTAAFPRRWPLIALGMIGIASGLEVFQLLSETRHARVEDAMVKGFGALAGILLALMIRQAWFLAERLAAQKAGEAARTEASPITAIFFNPEDGLLRLRFANGEERLFAGVQQGAVTGLMQAHEPMHYYLEHIDPHYERRAA